MLGVQTDYIKRGKVVERDLALRAGENWARARTIPRSTRSTSRASLLHELGHMAGNKQHTRALRELADDRGARRRRVVARRRATSGSATAEPSRGAASQLRKTLVHRIVAVDCTRPRAGAAGALPRRYGVVVDSVNVSVLL